MNSERVTRRVGSLITLRPECEEQYIMLHRQVPREVLRRLRKSNIRNYSIFLFHQYLFSFFEYVGDDFDADSKAIGDAATREWWALTGPMQNPLAGRKAGEWWAEMQPLQSHAGATAPCSAQQRRAYIAEARAGARDAVADIFALHDEALLAAFGRAHMQNHGAYLLDGVLCRYVEYTGAKFTEDDRALNARTDVKLWNENLGTHLISTWREMNEVFHAE